MQHKEQRRNCQSKHNGQAVVIKKNPANNIVKKLPLIHCFVPDFAGMPAFTACECSKTMWTKKRAPSAKHFMKFAWLIFSGLMGILASLPLRGENASVAIENAALRIEYDPVPGHFSVSTRMPAAAFLTGGQLSVEGGDASVQTVRHPVFGAGQAIVVDHPDGGRDTIELFPDLPFALFRTAVHNGGARPKIVDRLQPWHARAETGRPVAKLTTLGSGGLLTPEKNPGSYVWLALVDPQTRRGIVAGWLTGARGSGVVFSPVKDDQVRLDAQLDYGRLQLA
ncbi:MAG TPA: hypothetical protein VFB55_02465, partial [Verrucomicrobiae bacterium]|nr:hypothetical protein [Verrucomicrobiae bacterium]